MIVLRRYDLERAVTAVHRVAVSDETSVEVPLDEHLPSDFTGVWSPGQTASCQPRLVFERGHLSLSDSSREKWLCWVADAQVSAEELEACLHTRRRFPFLATSPGAVATVPGIGISFWKGGAILVVPRGRLLDPSGAWTPHPDLTFPVEPVGWERH